MLPRSDKGGVIFQETHHSKIRSRQRLIAMAYGYIDLFEDHKFSNLDSYFVNKCGFAMDDTEAEKHEEILDEEMGEKSQDVL